jgi:hypothetical protein
MPSREQVLRQRTQGAEQRVAVTLRMEVVKDVYRAMEVFEQRECLNMEERSRFDNQIMAASERLNQTSKQHRHLAPLPIELLDPIPKGSWRKRDAHTKADKRALYCCGDHGTRLQATRALGQKTMTDDA